MLPSFKRLFHQPCLMCLAPNANAVCDACLPRQSLIAHGCEQCGLPLEDLHTRLCGECLTSPKAISHTLAPFAYTAAVQKLLNHLKHQCPTSITQLLLPFLNQAIQTRVPLEARPQLLVPVPSHPAKKWVRGYNPAAYLAEQISQFWHIPVCHALTQMENLPPQKQSSRKIRFKNAERSFNTTPIATLRIQGLRVAIIDDVITTGATVNALAKMCLSSGAKSVDAWALARTPKPATFTR